jgi:L-alanine-DL-glutamate epimerase-like enolase superfamily enzyme
VRSLALRRPAPCAIMRAMKTTAIETFVVTTGFKPPRPWQFCAVRTDDGLTGYSEFGSDGITRGLVGLVQDLGARLIGKDPTAVEKHYGHLSSFQALNLVASVSNVKIMESDPDAVPVRDELFTVLPEIKDGHMTIPAGPGWGTELNEKAARAHAGED